MCHLGMGWMWEVCECFITSLSLSPMIGGPCWGILHCKVSPAISLCCLRFFLFQFPPRDGTIGLRETKLGSCKIWFGFISLFHLLIAIATISWGLPMCHARCACYRLLSWLWLLATSPWSNIRDVLSATALLSSCRRTSTAHCMESVHSYLGLLFSCRLLLFPALLSFPKKLASSWCAQCLRTVQRVICLFSYYSLFIILTITLENTCLFTLSPWSQWPFIWITVGDARPSPWFDFCLLWSLLHGAEELSLKVPVQTLAMAHTLQGSHLSQIKTIVLHWLLRSLWSLSPHFPYPSSWLGSSPIGLLADP